MKLVTSESMRAIDAECIEGLGIPGLKLMENAGVGTARFIERELGPLRGKTVTVVCGKGNNGGDGFVIARELSRLGAAVSVYLAGHGDDMSGDAKANLDRMGHGAVAELSDGPTVGHFVEAMRGSDLVVDALFGTGFNGAPRGLSGTVIQQMNVCGRPVLSVDVPSGLDATTGTYEGECVEADWTCTMGLPKRGFYVHPGRRLVGTLHVVDIGVPAGVAEKVGVCDNVLTAPEAAALLPERPANGHKGTFGKVLVVAGSVGYTGAAALASSAVLRAGAGLAFLGVPSSLNDVMEAKLSEVITRPLPETASRSLAAEAVPAVRSMLDSADSLAIGPGLSTDPDTQAFVSSVVSEVAVPCVIDADALSALTPTAIGERSGGAPVVLTPHPGEMGRLIGRSPEEVQANRDRVAREVAKSSGATVLLKGSPTVIADPDGELFVNPTGSSALASGGTGDVLTGIISTFLAQGLGATEAAALGAYVHGLAGEFAAESLGEAGVIASDVLDHIPFAMRELAEERA